MPTRDPASTVKVIHSISAQSVAGAATANGVNSQSIVGYRWAIMVFNVGNYSPGDNGSIRLQVSVSGTGGWGDVAGTVITVINTDDNVTFLGQVDLHKLTGGTFIRARFTNGSPGASLVSADIVLLGNDDTQGNVPSTVSFSV